MATASDVLPSPETPFGQRVRERLRSEDVIWLTTVGRDGTPQPNPVWFVWSGEDEVVVYSYRGAYRLTHIAAHPQVALHFNSTSNGDEVVVLRGRAERADELPGPDVSPEYLAKYRDGMIQVMGSLESFATDYSVPIRVRLTRVRGFYA